MSRVPLMDVHSTLSAVLHAVKLEMEPYRVGIELRYTRDLYLQVYVECPSHRVRQICVDRLSRGALQGDYDFRFKSIAHQPDSPEGYQTVWATVDLHHPRQKKVAA